MLHFRCNWLIVAVLFGIGHSNDIDISQINYDNDVELNAKQCNKLAYKLNQLFTEDVTQSARLLIETLHKLNNAIIANNNSTMEEFDHYNKELDKQFDDVINKQISPAIDLLLKCHQFVEKDLTNYTTCYNELQLNLTKHLLNCFIPLLNNGLASMDPNETLALAYNDNETRANLNLCLAKTKKLASNVPSYLKELFHIYVIQLEKIKHVQRLIVQQLTELHLEPRKSILGNETMGLGSNLAQIKRFSNKVVLISVVTVTITLVTLYFNLQHLIYLEKKKNLDNLTNRSAAITIELSTKFPANLIILSLSALVLVHVVGFVIYYCLSYRKKHNRVPNVRMAAKSSMIDSSFLINQHSNYKTSNIYFKPNNLSGFTSSLRPQCSDSRSSHHRRTHNKIKSPQIPSTINSVISDFRPRSSTTNQQASSGSTFSNISYNGSNRNF